MTDVENLEFLLQSVSNIIIGLSPQYSIAVFNHSAEQFYKCKAQEMIGKNFFEIFAAQGFRSPLTSSDIEIEEKIEIQIETQNGHGDTCIVHWQIHSLPSYKPYRILLIGKDTCFKENIISNNLNNIINSIPGSVYWKDKDGHYLGCNKVMVETSGLNSPNDIIGKTDFDLWPQQAAKLFNNDQKVIETGETIFSEEVVQIAHGKTLYFTSAKMPLLDESNNIVGIIGNSLDITPLKLAEQELARAKEEAEEANQLKTEFIRNMEHDIRTPFNGIYSMIKILEDQEEDLEKKEWLTAISKCSKQLLDYCNSILEFSRTEAGGNPLVKEKFNLRELIEKVAQMERPPAKIKNIEFIVDYPDEVPTLLIGDARRIHRILINLASNAVKFTDKGYVKIKVNAIKAADDKHLLIQLSVEDTGIGIPTEKQTLVYEKFMRLSPANKGLYEGCGLGLAIVKHLVEEMGGEIELNSEVNSGTTFTCLFPLELPLIAQQSHLLEA